MRRPKFIYTILSHVFYLIHSRLVGHDVDVGSNGRCNICGMQCFVACFLCFIRIYTYFNLLDDFTCLTTFVNVAVM